MSFHEKPNSQSYCLLIPTVVAFSDMNLRNQHDWHDTALNVYNCGAYPFLFQRLNRGRITLDKQFKHFSLFM